MIEDWINSHRIQIGTALSANNSKRRSIFENQTNLKQKY